MSKMYTPPSWAAGAPETGSDAVFSLEVIKNGVVLPDRIELSASANRVGGYFLLGRQDDAVDFILAHPSISRVHAVLQYRNDGAILLLDLKSAQGSFVNKKPCQEGVYERLYVGDVVKFGASSRLYVIHGPDSHCLSEYDSENLRAYRKRLVEKNEETAKRIEESNVISWGMSAEDAENEDDEQNEDHSKANNADRSNLPEYLRNDENYHRKYGAKFESTVRDEDFSSEKDKVMLEKIRLKERKIQNMQEENKKIFMKEASQDNGLTDGQIATVARNDKNVEKLESEIVEMAKTIQNKNLQRIGLSSSTARAEKNRKEDDDLLDETATSAEVETNWRLRKKKQCGNTEKPAAGSDTTWTYDSLCTERTSASSTLENVALAMSELRDQISKNSSSGVEVEEEERVVMAEIVREAETRLKKLADQHGQLAAKITSLDRLIKIAAPALISLDQGMKLSMPTAPTQVPIQSLAAPVASVLSDNPESSSGLNRRTENSANKRKMLDSARHPQGVSHFLKLERDNPAALDELEEPAKRIKTTVNPETHAYDEVDLWKPPSLQSRTDGKTALNERFGY